MHAYPASSSVSTASPARMNPWNWVLLVAGVLLAVLGMGLTIAGGILLGAQAAQQDGRYLFFAEQRYQSTGYAIVGPPLVLDLETAEAPGLPPFDDIASFQVRATSVIPDQDLFVGIADAAEIEAYLEDVAHASLGGTSWDPDRGLSGQWSWTPDEQGQLQEVAGTDSPAAPAEQNFWAASTVGTGTQELTFDLQQGQWTMVVMNADGSRPIWVDFSGGARTELLEPIGPGMLIAGVIGLVLGIPLVLLGAAGLGRNIDKAQPRLHGKSPAPGTSPGSGRGVYPLSFVGHLDTRLSRGLWLVKWLLAIPHYLVLTVLVVALLITTIAAGIGILFTGRYPKSWFAFSVGVLRWSWRVGFYGYMALGTDRYPPFTLADADYPAGLTVAYPEKLSRGLVLVKWWLLALPHLLLLSVLTGGGGFLGGDVLRSTTVWTFSLLGALLLIAAIALLFTGRYLPGLFHLVLGVNRWAYRVSTYVLLLRDEYPPFRLDQGPVDPPDPPAPTEPGPGTGTSQRPTT